ncbi:MAG: 2-oxo acid dehydrogenase subunit E2 [Okeania sp. SIO3B5]|uniref:dihydrolipoamide acetyltransferase family protein n=1 Tax=Okeania sp. SIO3B5 TaxID=2607811 RepID=UPI0013FEE0CC|nr:dihydrolipoamide acetyltransferase family protein [Okeania sp. SIO3B5]NEO54180.1 2-oxo acid dehydrogenase subunit E2 [Okeania sp. SIO3B5]
MINEVFMPALSSTMTEGKIVSWQKSTGDWVEKGETVVVVESDKADMDVESFFSGYLANIIVEAGDVATVGSTIALLAGTEAEIETAKQQGATTTKQETAPAASTAASAVATAPTSVTTETKENNGRRNGRIIASPRARKLAKKLKVDLSTLKGTGPHGRIVAEDVEMATGSTPTPAAALAKTATPVIPTQPSIPTAPPPPSAPPTPITPGQVVKMNTLQNAVVRNMMVSLSVPTYHVGYTITTDNLDALYKQIKSKGVTMTAMLAKAIAMTLQQHPLLNAAYVEGGIQYPSGINISVAVAMPDGGLITPVLQNADKMDIYSLSRTWKGLVEKARAKQLQPDEYSTGTFTLSNLGMFGVNQFDAILPPGQGSILAIGASKPQVVATADGMIGVKRQMQVNITCDHRIIYGADAAAFLQDLAKLIETNPQSLTM